MTLLEYTVTGQLLCDCCPMLAGDTVDIAIVTDNIAGVPDSIRGVIQLVEEVEIDGVEGRTYTIEYDETELGGNLVELRLCDIGSITCVSVETLAKEYTDAQIEAIQTQVDDIADANSSEVIPAANTADGFTKTVRVKLVEEVASSSAQSIATDIVTAATDLGVVLSNGDNFHIEVTAVVTTTEVVNNSDSLGKYSLVGRYNEGATVFTQFEQVAATYSVLSVTKAGNDLNVQLTNLDPDYSQYLILDYEVTINQ